MPRTILICWTLLALASRAYPGTISTYTVSASTAIPGVLPEEVCTETGSGPGTFGCAFPATGIYENATSADVTLTNNSIQASVDGGIDAGSSASAYLTQDDLYSVPGVDGAIEAVVSIFCEVVGFGAGGTYSLDFGAIQGVDQCNVYAAPVFLVPLDALNGVVELQTSAEAFANGNTDNYSSAFVELNVTGFESSDGTTLAATLMQDPATLMPEPATLPVVALALLVGASVYRRRNRQPAAG